MECINVIDEKTVGMTEEDKSASLRTPFTYVIYRAHLRLKSLRCTRLVNNRRPPDVCWRLYRNYILDVL